MSTYSPPFDVLLATGPHPTSPRTSTSSANSSAAGISMSSTTGRMAAARSRPNAFRLGAERVRDPGRLDGHFGEGTRTRWIFSELRPTSFSWRAVESDDDGETWTLRQEMWARRR